MPDFIQGDVARLAVMITDLQNLPVDPGGISVKIKTPGGVVNAYAYPGAVQKTTTGGYRYDVVLLEKGVYRWRWETDAPYQGAAQGSITAGASNLG